MYYAVAPRLVDQRRTSAKASIMSTQAAHLLCTDIAGRAAERREMRVISTTRRVSHDTCCLGCAMRSATPVIRHFGGGGGVLLLCA